MCRCDFVGASAAAAACWGLHFRRLPTSTNITSARGASLLLLGTAVLVGGKAGVMAVVRISRQLTSQGGRCGRCARCTRGETGAAAAADGDC